MRNLILSVDSYKQSHFLQYPTSTTFLNSYIEARQAPGGADQITMFFGLQAFIIEYLEDPITQGDIDDAAAVCDQHGVPFNRTGWQIILDEHDGFLPIEIEAIPEGTVVPRGTPMVQVRNTDPRLPWLTTFIETALLRAIWYPSSVATASFLVRAIIYDGLLRTSENPEAEMPFKLHDFGARGVSSGESAMLGGLAHLINFSGTDTMEALIAARSYYNADMAGFSVPAAEHSTVTSWGANKEPNAFRHMLDTFGNGLVSIVADSYNLQNAVENIIGKDLHDQIQHMNGKLVVRPDSGDPVETPMMVIRKLWAAFGGTTNAKGYKVLNPKVGVLQGDGMTPLSVARLVQRIIAEGFSVDNIVFGMGGGLLQGHMRDDMRFAMKVSAIRYAGGDWLPIHKDPVTDPSKTSKPGVQCTYVRDDGSIGHCALADFDGTEGTPLMRTVFSDGALREENDLEAIRARTLAALSTFHQQRMAEREAA